MKKEKTKDLLPNKPSKLLKVALRDLIKVESMPKYKIDMNEWMKKVNGDPCQVCHAGAVMACTLNTQPKYTHNDHRGKGVYKSSPGDFDNQTDTKLSFINCVREGNLVNGLSALHYGDVISTEDYERVKLSIGEDYDYDKSKRTTGIPTVVSDYKRKHREDYKNYIQAVIGILRAEGL